MRTLLRGSVVVALVAVALQLITSALMATASDQATTLVIAVKNDVETLDFQAEPNNTLIQLRQVFEPLIFRDKNGDMVPALAISWEYFPDEQAWVVHLREGVVFHNGEAFTAEDVKFSYDRILELEARSPQWVKGQKKIQEIQILDTYTVRFVMSEPNPLWPLDIATTPQIMPKDYYEEVGADGFAEHPISAGPYKFVSWARNVSMELVAFDEYWGGRPEVDRIIFRVLPDEATQVAELLTGGVDVILSVPAERMAEIEARPELEIVSGSSCVNQYLTMNSNFAPFDDVLVRRAVSHAIDVDAIAQVLFGQYYRRSTSIVQRTSFGFDPDIQPYVYDPERARQLLAEAGYPNGFETTLEVSEIPQWPRMELMAEAIVGYLAEVGITARFVIGEWADFFARFKQGDITGMLMWGNNAFTYDADRHLHLNFASPPGTQGFWWNNALVDRAIQEASESTDTQWRSELYSLAQLVIKYEAGAVPLIETNVILGVNSKFDVPARGDGFVYVVEVGVR